MLTLLEGRDEAGKGGVTKCMTERISPRVSRVVALPALTERLLGFATEEHVEDFLPVAPNVARVVIASGIMLLKHLLEVGREEQTRRARLPVPLRPRALLVARSL